MPAEYCEAYSLLFQVQRLAQYEQYFQSILRESHHDHADLEDVSRAAAKAKQVGDILNMLSFLYKEDKGVISKDKKKYSLVPLDFRKISFFWKVPRLRPFLCQE